MNETVLIYGMEAVIKTFLPQTNPRRSFQSWIGQWLAWEEKVINAKLILIGSDIGKGIVPVGKEDRQFRDLVGWCFQDLVEQASRVDLIWYGINQQLK
jgi:adenosyl cobinamide kinase/adenosyl cobinamide phosphate guanylyltransferase